ncbi:ATPase family associated with various cellular activities (AAA) [Phycisphaerae bacterium RAS2]|nr:ATPase family associated with various cellular activities (AAA) [Phycisphaerae bacterium RAS2]
MTQLDVKHIGPMIKAASEPFARLREAMHRVIVGQEALIDHLLVGLLANGHMLLEGVPGLAKTLSVTCLARGIQTGFSRIQFTPDLLPADVIGTLIYQPQQGTFTVKKGPIFSNIILADEINRAPAKVQSALLEAMQERQVTIGDETFALPEPFLVLATQNPIEQEGTYPLPEAQVDRFMFKVTVTYPSREQERQILDRMATTLPEWSIEPVMQPSDIIKARQTVDEIYIDDKIKDYVVSLVIATRDPSAYGLKIKHLIQYGASPRATIMLTLGAKARAFLAGRGFVTPQDVKDVAPGILRHRVIITYEAEAEEMTSDAIVKQILDHVPVP